MDHLAFYNVGSEPGPGTSKPKAFVRRQFRRVFLPSFLRLAEILASLCHRLDAHDHELRDLRGKLDELRRRHDDQAAKLPATIAFGWDYVAMVRRLAVLEQHVATLLNQNPTDAEVPTEVVATARGKLG
jgi:uncharacterized caspase-like protein